jgi:hypothetical protein
MEFDNLSLAISVAAFGLAIYIFWRINKKLPTTADFDEIFNSTIAVSNTIETIIQDTKALYETGVLNESEWTEKVADMIQNRYRGIDPVILKRLVEKSITYYKQKKVSYAS